VDEVFRALADPSRQRLLDRLNERTRQTLRELCAGQNLTRQPVSKHLVVLDAANLVTTYGGPGEAALSQRRAGQRHRRPVGRPLQRGACALSDLKVALAPRSCPHDPRRHRERP
jgi:DNA-binding transcriptional ArsR family regulator